VNGNPDVPSSPRRGRELRKVPLEAIVVAVLGAAVAFAANGLSPRGLTLTRNYFPGTNHSAVTPPAPSPITGIKQKGLRWIDTERALRLFADPGLQQQMIVFVDARDEEQ
jgi:hypothetical protein